MNKLEKFFESILQEAKYAGQIGYHFCTDNQLIHNCIFDCIDYNPTTHDSLGDVTYTNARGVSLSRDGKNKRLISSFSHLDDNPNDENYRKWRIAIDMGKLSEDYKLKPINDVYPKRWDWKKDKYYWSRPDIVEDYKNASLKDPGFYKSRGYYLAYQRFETEERVEGSIFNLHKYIVAIDYIPYIKGLEDLPHTEPFISTSYKAYKNREGPEAVINYIKKWNISTNYDFTEIEKKFGDKSHLVRNYDEDLNKKIANLPNNVFWSLKRLQNYMNIFDTENPSPENMKERILDITIDLKNVEVDEIICKNLKVINSKFGIKLNIKFSPITLKGTEDTPIIFDFEGIPIKTIDFSNVKFEGFMEYFTLNGCLDLEEIKNLDLSNVEILNKIKTVKMLKTLPKLRRKNIKFKSGLMKQINKKTYKRDYGL